MTIPTKPSGAPVVGSEPSYLRHDGDPELFSEGISDYVDLIKLTYSSAFSFTHAEWWSKPTKDDDPLFIYDVSLGIAGSDAGAVVVAEQCVITFRTSLGGLYRNYMMENMAAVNLAAYPPFSTNYANIANFIMSDASFFYGRDNGKPTSVISLKTKTNDALRRQLITG
jgi:hypothetical protein